MKLGVGYSHSFSSGKQNDSNLWKIINKHSSLNGFFIANKNTLSTSNINKINFWSSSNNDGNYLYTDLEEKATYIPEDSRFNNQPSIEFPVEGNVRFKLDQSLSVGTLFIVYLTKVNGSYLIYSPRSTYPTGTPDTLYYDAYPPGLNGELWGRENLNSGSIYNAKSRINGKEISSNAFIPLNSSRILSVRDIDNITKTESIEGFGGQYGVLNGTNNRKTTVENSVNGNIACIITFEDSLDLESVIEIETELAKLYSSYTGPVLNSIPKFKTLINSLFLFDFSTIVIDEWFDIVSYQLISPVTSNLSFTGSVLSGIPFECINTDLVIRVTNSNDLVKDFSFNFEVVRKDPIVNNLPSLNNLTLVLSADKSNLDNEFYGIYLDDNFTVIKWDDARRVNTNSKTLYKEGVTSPLINSNSLLFQYTDSLLCEENLSAKTFVWVYKQPTTYGLRQLLDTFPDIYGKGQLWTVSTNTEIHGTTAVTKLLTKLNNISINTFSYKLDKDTIYIITAKTFDDSAINFKGFKNMIGNLYFFAAWNNRLSDIEISNTISVLADRYIPDNHPRILNTNREYRTVENVTIDLKTKISDLSLLPLSYEIIQNNRNAIVDSNGILSFTAVTDEVLTFVIDVTNTIPLTTRLTFVVETVLKTNSLYLAIKEILPLNFNAFYIVDSDSYTLSSGNLNQWNDYRANTRFLTSNSSGINLQSRYELDNKNIFVFNLDGSSYLDFDTDIQGKAFVFAYVRDKDSTNYAFLLGTDSDTYFASGLNGRLFDESITSAYILNSLNYVNGERANNSHYIIPEVLNNIIINSINTATASSIAKDRVLTDRSVKGGLALFIAYPETITEEQSKQLNTVIRDYYDSVKAVILLDFNNLLIDSSTRNKTVSTVGASFINTAIKHFGNGGFNLVHNNQCNYLTVPNQSDFCFLNEDYTVSFWINLTAEIINNQKLSIFSFTNLNIYIINNILYFGATQNSILADISYTLNTNFYNKFNLITVVRKNKKLFYFINGILIHEKNDTNSYIDIDSPCILGQTINLSNQASNIFCILDNFIIYRRKALYDSNFPLPTSPYS